MKSVRSKMQQRDIEPHKEKEVKQKGIETKAEKQVLSRISEDIAHEASGIHEQITGAGQFVYDNFNTTAKAQGLSLVDYVQRAMIFYTNYHDLIERLEGTIKDQERTITELTEILNPIPWRMKIIESMVAQEASGKIYSEGDIVKFLDAIDYALGKDIIRAQPPRTEGVEVAGQPA